MPWPDVPTALKQGVITGLDHTLLVCYLTKKFEVAKNFTPVNYAQACSSGSSTRPVQVAARRAAEDLREGGQRAVRHLPRPDQDQELDCKKAAMKKRA